jgi:hypothetical protein
MIIPNEEVSEIIAEIPEGHTHVRVRLILRDGQCLTLQEATVANLVRAFISVKTHPLLSKVHLKGRHLPCKKQGYADWQLLEDQS